MTSEGTSGKASSFTSSMVLAMLYQFEASVARCKLASILHYGTEFSYGISNLIWDDLVPAVLFVRLAPLQWRAVIASTASRAASCSET